MFNYYAELPLSAAKPYFDGNLYVFSDAHIAKLPNGKITVRSTGHNRMLRVVRTENDKAVALLGRAGDAIDNLPIGVIAQHEDDANHRA